MSIFSNFFYTVGHWFFAYQYFVTVKEITYMFQLQDTTVEQRRKKHMIVKSIMTLVILASSFYISWAQYYDSEIQ